jgi:hypothetical protein
LFGAAPERQEWVILASFLGHFEAKMAQKRPKMGHNRAVQVTYQLTMYFCMVLILFDLRYFYRRKSDNITMGGWVNDDFGWFFCSESPSKIIIPIDIMRSWALILRKEIAIHHLPFPERWRATCAPWETSAESNPFRHPEQRDGATQCNKMTPLDTAFYRQAITQGTEQQHPRRGRVGMLI